MSSALTPTLLLILDGWGDAPASEGNAFACAKTPVLDNLLATSPRTKLLCSGREVGLPKGFMGNSEVGHMNIGAGRVVYQEMTRIDITIEENTFADNPVIAQAITTAKTNKSTLHLMGLLSDGGVHSHLAHLTALMRAAEHAQIPVALHLFTDGRDTNPTSGVGFLKTIQQHCSEHIRIASLTGRYYAMDRDKHWERTQLAWDLLVHGKGAQTADPVAYMEAQYAQGITDEFMPATAVVEQGKKPCVIADGDVVFFFNFRADRARQMTRCLSDAKFAEFDRGTLPVLGYFGTMTPYDATLPVPAAFVRDEITHTLGEEVAAHGLKQFRIAETEKYAHVTYFFNGGQEQPAVGEDQRLIPSPRDIATYDLRPAMSAVAVTDALLEAIATQQYTLIVCNFANMDMVGHTGNLAAAIEACEAVDACIGRIVPAMQAQQGRIIITADHGNVEEMLSAQHTPQTTHSKNPVNLLLVEKGKHYTLKEQGKLADIAPTILHLWNLPVPQEMTGVNLLEK